MAARRATHWPITLTNGATSVVNIFLPLILVRILSPDQVGRYQIFFLYMMLFPGLFLTAGLTNGLYHWAGKYPASKPEIRQSWTLLVSIIMSVCIIGFIASPWLAPLVKFPRAEYYCILLSAPVTLGASFIEDLMVSRGRVWAGAFYASIFNILKSLSITLAAVWTRDVLWVFGTFVGISAIRALTGWILFYKTDDLKFTFSKEETLSVLRYALPVSLAALAGMALSNVDQMILSFRLTPAAFAFYALGCLSVPPLDIFETSVNRILIPKLSKAFAMNQYTESRLLFADAVSELYRFLLPATVGLVIFAEPIILILFTKHYLSAAHYLRIYALMYVFWAFPFDAVARAKGDGKWILRMSLLFAPIAVLTTWMAAGLWSAMGALTAALITKIAVRLYSLTYDRKTFGVPCTQFLPLKDMGIQTLLAAFASIGPLLFRPLFSDIRVWFLLTGTLFSLVYFGLTYAIYMRRLYTNLGPVRVLELTQTLGLGGLERTVYLIANNLNQNWTFNVRVATYDQAEGQPSLLAQFQKSEIPVIHWQKCKGFSIPSVLRLMRMISSERIRVLHVHDLGPLIYGSLAKILSFGTIRLVLTVHTLLDVDHNPRYRRYYKFFLRFPDKVVAVSPGVQSGLLALGINPERVRVIPNGVSFTRIPKDTSGGGDRLSIRKVLMPNLSPDLYNARWALSLARLHPGKGQDVLLNVWSALSPSIRARLVLLFVGQETDPEYASSLKKMIQGAPDRDRLLIVGPAEQPEKWIQCVDFFISGSLHEGMPLAPLEAAGSGLPTLLSKIEGHQYLSQWARYFDPANHGDGALKIKEILEELETKKDVESLDNRWQLTSILRERWGTDAMVTSYAKLFQTGECS